MWPFRLSNWGIHFPGILITPGLPRFDLGSAGLVFMACVGCRRVQHVTVHGHQVVGRLVSFSIVVLLRSHKDGEKFERGGGA